jgi:hypothetical protein
MEHWKIGKHVLGKNLCGQLSADAEVNYRIMENAEVVGARRERYGRNLRLPKAVKPTLEALGD